MVPKTWWGGPGGTPPKPSRQWALGESRLALIGGRGTEQSEQQTVPCAIRSPTNPVSKTARAKAAHSSALCVSCAGALQNAPLAVLPSAPAGRRYCTVSNDSHGTMAPCSSGSAGPLRVISPTAIRFRMRQSSAPRSTGDVPGCCSDGGDSVTRRLPRSVIGVPGVFATDISERDVYGYPDDCGLNCDATCDRFCDLKNREAHARHPARSPSMAGVFVLT